MPADMFKVMVSFQDAAGNPLSGPDYTVRLMDEDRFFDDSLGSSHVGADGRAEFLVAVADILSIDSPGERTPDIYFVLFDSGEEIYRSSVISEIDFDARDPVTGRPKGLTREFGPYRVDGGAA